MAEQDRTTLDGFFNAGDIPTEGQFQDLIDSYVNSREDGRSGETVDSMAGLLTVNTSSLKDGATVIVQNFYSDTEGGGGPFYWDSSEDKANHNGGTVINPDHLSTIGSANWYSSTGDSTDDTGSGCWKRPDNKSILASTFGVSPSQPDNASALQAAIDYLNINDDEILGGVLELPRGVLVVESPITIETNNGTGIANFTLRGLGMQSTSIKAGTSIGSSDDLLTLDGTFIKLENLNINGNSECANGIVHAGGSHLVYERIRSQNCNDAGFLFDGGFMMSFEDLFSTSNGIGFDFQGYHTSTHLQNCYADNNTLQGFKIDDMSYSSLIDCASDRNREGYYITKCNSLNVINSGAESCGRAAFHFEASQSSDDESGSIIDGIKCKLDGCFSYNNDADNNGYGSSIYTNQADTSSIDLVVERFDELNSPNGTSVVSAGNKTNHFVQFNQCDFQGNYSTNTSVFNDKKSIKVDTVSVTSANTPVINLQNVYGFTDQYSGLLSIIAVNGDYAFSGNPTIANYVLLVTKAGGNSGVVEIAKNGLVSGNSSTEPSFTWSLDTSNNNLEASPVGSTSDSFRFHIIQIGGLDVTNI